MVAWDTGRFPRKTSGQNSGDVAGLEGKQDATVARWIGIHTDHGLPVEVLERVGD
jgi:hypothetical protein